MSYDTVGDLIDALSEHERSAPIRIAIQPTHTLECPVGSVASVEVDESGGAGDLHEVVYIGAMSATDYAPGAVTDALINAGDFR